MSANWHAGIVVSNRNGPVADDPHGPLNPDLNGVREQPMAYRSHPPRDIVLAFNRVLLNASSGICFDGGVELVIFDNHVEGNVMEIVCLDNGSTTNIRALNSTRSNGKRWDKTDAELRLATVDGTRAGCPTAAPR